MIIPLFLLLLPLLLPTSAKEDVALALLKSTDNGANNTEAIRQALDGFTSCIIEKSGINSMLPEFLTESIAKIFGEECQAKHAANQPNNEPHISGSLKSCKDHGPRNSWPLLPAKCDWDCIQEYGDCCLDEDSVKCYYKGNKTMNGYQECWKSTNGNKITERCWLSESAPKCICADKDGADEDEDKIRKEKVSQCVQNCGNCIIDQHTSTDGPQNSRETNCSYTRLTLSGDFEQDCLITKFKAMGGFGMAEVSIGSEMSVTKINCAPPKRIVPFAEKMLNASLECMSQVDTLQCCNRENVARECMPLCGQGDVKTLSMKQLSVCQLHFGSIMKCYVQKVTGKDYDKSQDLCAEACAICDSVKACSLSQFLPGSLGDFALSLCLAEGNMQCKLAKLRGGCL